ncbi:putative transporter small subunit [Pararhodobacter oceanensis]|nr:putative transporter small subunit [Pararhodobacter oceanensis]
MSPTLLSIYVLMFPATVAGVLSFLLRAFFLEWRSAREDGRSMI